jgi:uncharacterized delta-60 repeat protein
MVLAVSQVVAVVTVAGPASAATGDLDSTFGASGKAFTDFGAIEVAKAVVAQADGKIVAVGVANEGTGHTDIALARYNADGTLDATFGVGGTVTTDLSGLSIEARAVAIQVDGKIVVAGPACSPSACDVALARYNVDGTLDANFGTGGTVISDLGTSNDQANALVIQGGKITVGGIALGPANNYDFALARYDTDGTLDATFGVGGVVTTDFGSNDVIRGLAPAPGGKVVAGGIAGYSSASSDFALARYNSDGSLDDTFGSGGKVTTNLGGIEEVRGIAVQTEGKIVTAGFTTAPSHAAFAIARYNTDGSLDATFGSGGSVVASLATDATAEAVAIRSDGGIVIAGRASDVQQRSDYGLLRLDANGNPDPAFGTAGQVVTDMDGTSDQVSGVAIQTDGKIVAAGAGRNGDLALARYQDTSSQAQVITFPLTVTQAGAGGGVVTASPSGISGSGILAAGANHTCAIKADGTLACWGGENGKGQTNAPAGTFSSVSAGANHTCAIKADGTLACWGQNSEGVTDAPAGTFSSVAAGGGHTCAIKTVGTLACWGTNSSGQLEGIPAGTFSSVSSGIAHTCAIRTDRTLACWGSNSSRQTDAPLGTFSSVSAGGSHTCAIRTDGTLACWGYDGDRQTDAPLGTFSSVSSGWSHTCAIKTDGTLACWGDNSYGQTTVPAGTFSSVTSGGAGYTCAIKTDGTVECWGRNQDGQTNASAGSFAAGCQTCLLYQTGTLVTLTATPYATSAFDGWSGEGCAGTGTCMVTMDQVRNVTATFTEATYPLEVTPAGSGAGSVTSSPTGIDCGTSCQATFDAGTQVTLSASADPGSRFDGWLGDCTGTTTACTVTMTQARSVSAGFTTLPHDPVWGWGVNDSGQAGATACSTPCPVPSQVAGLSGVVSVAGGNSHSLALKANGTVWGWGSPGFGVLGGASCSSPCPPVQVPSLSGITAIASGQYHALALRSDNQVVGWGLNGYGAVGPTTCQQNCVPTDVTGLTDVVAISAGEHHSVALRADGSVWTWGDNAYGQLGRTGCSTDCPPAQVPGLSDIVRIDSGGYHTMALRADGSVWGWGYNGDGRVGDPTCPTVCSPTKVEGLPSIGAIAAGGGHSLALDDDGNVWGWGVNGHRQLGARACVSGCPPSMILGLPRIVTIAAGDVHSMALASDGTVWGWGYNQQGQLGSTLCTSFCPVPTQVVGLSGVVAIDASYIYSLAIADSFTPPGESVTEVVVAGDPPVTTDTEGDGATPADPVETAVTSPQGGEVTIADVPNETVAPTGYNFLGSQVQIEAPPATVDVPLVIDLRLDASLIPAGQTAQTVAVFRNGNYILSCTGAPGKAEPDPCVSDRQTLTDGDVVITVLTSHASLWNLGFPAPIARAGGPYTVVEGSTVRLDATASTGAGTLTYAWSPSLSLDGASLARPTFSGVDDASQELTLQVTDATGQGALSMTTVTVTNAAPAVTVSGPATVASGATVALASSFTDAGRLDTHTASVNWGDGTTTIGTVTETNGSGTVAGSHRYLVPGSYAIAVTVTDDDGGIGQASSASFSVSRAPVGIDVKPGDSSNTIQLSSKQVAVAVLSTATFDATTKVVRTSLTFGRTGSEASLLLTKGVPSCSTPDVNGDGRKDLQCNFTTSLLGLRTTDTQAILRARTIDGVYLEGRNTVRVTK